VSFIHILTSEEGDCMRRKGKNDLSFPKTAHNDIAFHHALNNTDRGVIFTNRHNEILYVNEKFSEITGYSFADVKGKTPKFMQSGIQSQTFYDEMKESIYKNNRWSNKLWNRTKDGDIYLQELNIIAIRNGAGEIENFIGFIRKLSGRGLLPIVSKIDGELYDPLTRLPNRVLFEKRLYSTLQLMKANDVFVTLTLLKIENFHQINLKHGLVFGNVLLKRIAERLVNNSPVSSMISRWAGTKFACVTEEFTSKEAIEEAVRNFAEIITKPYVINGVEIEVSVSFGIVINEHNKEDIAVSALLANAQKALLEAREQKALLCFYHKAIEGNKSFVVTEEEVARAIEAQEFELYYQPLLATGSDELVGFEALIRWNHPDQGLIPPGEFIPLAEKTGLINNIGAGVFEQACRQQVIWSERGYRDLFISVNLSMNQFEDDFLIHFIADTIERTGADSSRISVELTETSFSKDKENTVLKLKQLNSLGLTIAIDDFGTGYSSLGYLIDFPISVIKIDRSFIQELESNEKIEAIVKAINSMAQTLNIEVVAEGIETKAQYELVKKLQCNIVQGYLFDRPQKVTDIERKWLTI